MNTQNYLSLISEAVDWDPLSLTQVWSLSSCLTTPHLQSELLFFHEFIVWYAQTVTILYYIYQTGDQFPCLNSQNSEMIFWEQKPSRLTDLRDVTEQSPVELVNGVTVELWSVGNELNQVGHRFVSHVAPCLAEWVSNTKHHTRK